MYAWHAVGKSFGWQGVELPGPNGTILNRSRFETGGVLVFERVWENERGPLASKKNIVYAR